MVTETHTLSEVPTQSVNAVCIQRVQKFIRLHIDSPLDRRVLAAVAGFPIPHFHRIFLFGKPQVCRLGSPRKRSFRGVDFAGTGESAAAYVRRIRLERAGRKLRMGAINITEVALAAGYATTAAFSKAFKKQYGLSPSQFRMLNCSEATQLLRKR